MMRWKNKQYTLKSRRRGYLLVLALSKSLCLESLIKNRYSSNNISTFINTYLIIQYQTSWSWHFSPSLHLPPWLPLTLHTFVHRLLRPLWTHSMMQSFVSKIAMKILLVRSLKLRARAKIWIVATMVATTTVMAVLPEIHVPSVKAGLVSKRMICFLIYMLCVCLDI